MTYLLTKKRAFAALASQVKGVKTTKTGAFPVTLTGCVDNDCIANYKIHGSQGGVGDLYDDKYHIAITTRSKNVFDVTKCTNYDSSVGGLFLPASLGYGNLQGIVGNIMDIVAGRTYIMTAKSTSTTGNYVYLYGSKRVIRWGQAFVPTADDISGRILFYKGKSGSEDMSKDITITDIQVEEASTATSYESYHAPISTIITIPSQLAADEYISYTAQAVVHADGTKTSVALPKIPTYKGTTVLEQTTDGTMATADITYYVTSKEE